MKRPLDSDERHGEPHRDEFAALFAALDQPPGVDDAHHAYELLLTRAASPSFRRNTLGRSY